MNVCLLSPYQPQTGGVPVHTSGLVKSLSRKNKVTVITYGRLGRKGSERIRVVEVPVPPVRFLRGLCFFMGAVIQLFMLSRKKAFDVVHAEYMLPLGAAALFFRKFSGKKPLVVVTAHGSDLLSLGRGWLSGRLVRRVGNSSDRVICVSDYLAKEAVDLGIHAGKVHVIRNGIGEDALPRSSRASLRKVLGLPENERIITFVGSLSETKGADIFVILAFHFHERVQGLRFCLVGGGPDEGSLKRYCSKRGMKGIVTFVGRKSHQESLRYIKASDALVIPSRIEGFGLTALEGMRIGVPIAASRSGALGEVLGGSSLTDNIPWTLRKILTSKTFRDRMVKENRKLSMKYSWEKMANETEKVYRSGGKSA
ncbi:MAG: glycosyltransferase family 4 protein [Candidatus Aenigmarchaeota archaeon]|nr:glycosyltransferase family 4 protein [Candidatus Aenigmarchaeota archaeon]